MSLHLIAWFGFSLFDSSPVPASQPSPPAPLSVTVSGGVSLGAYEAGYLYYLSETLKLNPDKLRLKIATGSSAGSINALLTGIESCLPPERDPRQTQFFRAWTTSGIRELYDPQAVKPTSLFSRRALGPVVDELGQRLLAGLPETCDFVFGATTTRLNPEGLAVREGLLSLPRSEEKFLLRVRGRGMGRPVDIENYVDRQDPLAQMLLPVDGDSESELEALRELLYASSAFPLAFSPVALAYCTTTPGGHPNANAARCVRENATRSLFIDGGVFDNQPVRLAARAALFGLDEKDLGSFRDVPVRRFGQLPKEMQFWSIDPHAQNYPEDVEQLPKPPRTWLELVLNFADDYVSTASSKTLFELFQQHPELIGHIMVGARYFPTASGLLANFFGFFDSKLRVFDFYLGMHDAYRIMQEHVRKDDPNDTYAKLTLPEMTLDRVEGRLPPGWDAYQCIGTILETNDPHPTVCGHDIDHELIALAQTTKIRLYDHCRRLAENGLINTSQRECQNGMLGKQPFARPTGKTATAGSETTRDDWRSQANESDLDYTIRLLSERGFVFDEIGIKAADADLTATVLRNRMQQIVARFADVQPSDGALLRVAAQPLLSVLKYAPPEHILHLVFGPLIEFGWSYTSPTSRWQWLRLSAALELDGLSTLTRPNGGDVGLLPLLGVELEPLPLNSASIATRFGLRGGLMLSTGDAMFTSRCSAPSNRSCSRPAIESHIALSVFERLRLQLGFVLLPPIRGGEPWLWAIIPSAGGQFNLPF